MHGIHRHRVSLGGDVYLILTGSSPAHYQKKKIMTQDGISATDSGVAFCACKGIRRCLKCDVLMGKDVLEANEPKVNIKE